MQKDGSATLSVQTDDDSVGEIQIPAEAECFLKPAISFEQFDAVAQAISDNEAAQRHNQARSKLFRPLRVGRPHGAFSV